MSIKAEDIKEVKNEVVVEETVENCEEKTGFFSKVKTGLKKHGKKVAIAAAVGTVGLIGYALGSRTSDDTDDVLDDIVADVDYSDIADDITE